MSSIVKVVLYNQIVSYELLEFMGAYNASIPKKERMNDGESRQIKKGL